MADRTETAIAVLVLAAAGLVIAAPLVGRQGHPALADLAMAAAALAGVAAFALAAVHTIRAARRHHRPGRPRGERGGSDA